MPTAVRSHAKINLGLYLGAPRADGFHSLTTVYQTLEVHDIVTVKAIRSAQTTLRLSSNDARVPTDERNTAWKMVSLALEEMGTEAAVEIHIEKRLPVQGGLGAGSGNAVAALVGLEKELEKQGTGIWEQGSESKGADWARRWGEIAAKVGSDVPLFLIGGTVLGQDRGQEVSALPDLEPTWCLVVVPEVGVSTPQAFRDWDALCAQEGLTAEASADRLRESSRAYASAFRGAIPESGPGAGSSGVFSAGEDLAGPKESALVRTGITSWIENDFERVVFPQHPSLAEIKRLLAAPGTPEVALYSALSGSGSALFGLYMTLGDAEAAQNRIERESQALKVRNTVITRTLPRKAYWDQMVES
ncbi:MAG: 4-(cytidine 5'-diphospho)-2-C-methyl-D-erythritol kinase [Terracidiphilus sp.]|nr:4-(cytidine 5'-diphospho)-2-C-methyl-D-erythritol kinase [Terracidiphilus sp.]